MSNQGKIENPKDSPFQKFIDGHCSEWVILDQTDLMVVLEEKPLVAGHCVIFPKRIIDAWNDLSEHELSRMMAVAKKIAVAIKESVPCKKVGLAILGLQVRHAHLHLVPIQTADDLNFTRPKLDLSHDELHRLANELRKNLNEPRN
jgi:histidine triad (HIT) family protein